MKTLLTILSLTVTFAACKNAPPLFTEANEETTVAPEWAPAEAPATAKYYYFPDYEVYYNVPQRSWVYFDGSIWVTSAVRPTWCAHIDLFNAHIVWLDYFGPSPWIYHFAYHKKFPPRHGHAFGPRAPMGYKGMPPGQAKKYFGTPPPGQMKKNGNAPGKLNVYAHPSGGFKASQMGPVKKMSPSSQSKPGQGGGHGGGHGGQGHHK